MLNNTKTDHSKSIFSYNVYRTNNHQARPNLRPPPTFKSSSLSSTLSKDPEILYFNEKILRRKTKNQKVIECSTQTSKTILQLAQLETIKNGTFITPFPHFETPPQDGPLNLSLHVTPPLMSPDSLAASPRNVSMLNCPYSVTNRLSDYTLDGSCTEHDLKKNSEVRSQSFIESYPHPNYIQDPAPKSKIPKPRFARRSSKSLELPDNSFVRRVSSPFCHAQNSFMSPTKSSQIKSNMADIKSANFLIPPMRRGRSTSPKPTSGKKWFETSRKIPYIDQSRSDMSSSTTLVNASRNPELVRLEGIERDLSKSELSIKISDDVLSLITNAQVSNSSVDTTICMAVNKLREPDWRLALRGLADIVEICRVIDIDLIYDYMPSIHQRLIELLKSPRSHVCRTACQAAGHLFEYVKDTRRPEFDDIVDILLHKTADSNRFIRHDANLALDCMVTHISTFNAVRALCQKGPFHKNPLVRCATVRLLVCAIVIAGPDFVLNPNNNEYTRKRVILNMARFLEDKNLDTRKLAERLYKVLSKDTRFEVYLKKYLEKEQITKIKKTLRIIHKK
ncbi:uncharacterized protein LOC123009763 isoform X1 [Tribolium madens]|uniref:uncharacterized protein LOC123009763 isoform X1 n=1 Tax=Tribolium madens TaxID=41895 RepID=UPI001CF7246B|nr:uncharacterized protein LOC123009763 isoform X1 [Tribolium madens]